MAADAAALAGAILAVHVAPTAVAAGSVTACPPTPRADPAMLSGLANQSHPDRGLLWEVSEGPRRSFLYGTVHVAKLAWSFPGPALKSALDASNEVAVELDLTDPTLAVRMATAANEAASAETRSGTAADLAPDEVMALQARLSRLFREACLDESAFSGASMGSKVTSLTMLSARDAGLYPHFAIDASLVGYARATGKKVVELETSTEQAVSMRPDPASIARGLAGLEDGTERSHLMRLTSGWARGDFADIERCFAWAGAGEEQPEMQHLLRERNVVLAERIGRLFDQGDGVSAALGVLHMIGKVSAVSERRRQGFSVRLLAAPRSRPNR